MRFKVGDKCKVLDSPAVPSIIVGKMVVITCIPKDKGPGNYIEGQVINTGDVYPFFERELELFYEHSVIEEI